MSLRYQFNSTGMTICCRSTKLSWFGFVWVLLSSVGYAVAAPCGDVFSETLASCCPLKYSSLCCPGITEPCNATVTFPPPLEEQNNSPPGIQQPAKWRKPYCMRPLNSTACEAGFYFDSGSAQVRACPDGFYCPQNLLCIIPCPVGAYCMRNTVVNSTRSSPSLCREGGKCCSPSQSVPLYDVHSKELLCPGTYQPVACPEGNYCPEVTIIKTCPKGHFCRIGSTEPQKCPLLSICKKGSSAPVSAPAGLLLIVFLFLLWILFLYCFKHEKKVRFYYNHYKEKWLTRNYMEKNLKTGLTLTLVGIDTSLQEYKRNAVAKKHTISIKFTELGLVLKKGGRRVLEGVTGEIKPGELTAVMGPSGSGKTTLLNTLSGKAYYGNRSGSIFINNTMVDDLGAYRNITGFVPQEDVMHRSLTVIEVLTYQAHLRLPSSTSNDERKNKITEVLQLLDLERVKDTTIGDEETRGISGGQRKRVNIGMELVADPTLLFLDEPTSGLDSTSSLMVVGALKAVAENAKLTVVCVIHQPRYEIFSKFHKVLFLGLGGRTVFQGTVEEAEDYFHNRGFEKPINVNPADFYMDVIGGMYESSQPQALSLVEEWEQNQINTRESEREGGPIQETVRTMGNNNLALDPDLEEVTLAQVKESSDDHVDTGPSTAFQRRKMPNFFVQFCIFLRREVYLQFRLARSLLLDQFLVLLAGATLGALRREAPLDEFFTLQTLSSLAIGLTAMLSALRCFGNHRTSFWRESSAGINRVSYFVAVNVAQVPIILVTPLIYLSLMYPLVAPRGLFRFHYLATLGAQFACTGVGYAISAIFSPKNSQMASVTYILICALVSGSSPSLCKMNNNTVIGPLLYSLSYSRWYLEALFEKEANRYPRVMAPYVHGLAARSGYSLDNYSACVAVLFGMGFAYRLLALLFLLFTNRGKQQ